MTKLRMIPDTSDREVDWALDPEAGRELSAGLLYFAGAMAVLNRWVLRDAEKHEEVKWRRRELGMLRGREATA